jgi:hypothetical protein
LFQKRAELPVVLHQRLHGLRGAVRHSPNDASIVSHVQTFRG